MSDAEQRAARCVIGRDYAGPLVDHVHERRAAIDRYAAATR
jgi:deoxyribodipyrimidine photolyase